MTRGWVSLILADQWELCNSHHPCYQMFERWLLEEWFLPIQSSLKKLTWNFLNKHAGRIFPLQVFQISGVFSGKPSGFIFSFDWYPICMDHLEVLKFSTKPLEKTNQMNSFMNLLEDPWAASWKLTYPIFLEEEHHFLKLPLKGDMVYVSSLQGNSS